MPTPATPGASPRRRRGYGRLRAASLLAVHLLIAAHIAHFLLQGSSLAPLEISEVLYTAHVGVVTAGAIFMALALVSVLVVGRFFCSWGCHLLALQDLAAWGLRRVGVKPRPLRSRTLLWVPPLALLYLFVWPHVERLLEGRPLPSLHIVEEGGGWASFVTANYFRNLPPLGIGIATLLLCGMVIVYLLGSRAFCAYGCPWGVLFGLADRVAPGRIRLRGDCNGCGACTKVCSSDVDVMEEVQREGHVVSSRCLKDLDCVSACPSGALGVGFGRPSLLGRVRGAPPRPYDFTLGEDLSMALAFLFALLAYRGLYDAVPFLLAMGIAALLAFLSVLGIRLWRDPAVRFRGALLKETGRLSSKGRLLAVALVALFALSAHSAWIRYHEHLGLRAVDRIAVEGDVDAVDAAIDHLGESYRFGLVHPLSTARRLASLHLRRAEDPEAEPYLRAVLSAEPADADARWRLGLLLARTGHPESSLEHLRRAARDRPGAAPIQNDLGVALGRLGRDAEAAAAFERAALADPSYAAARVNLGLLLAARGRLEEAAEHLRAAVELDPRDRRARAVLSALESELSSSRPGG